MKGRILGILLSLSLAAGILSGCGAVDAFKAGYESGTGGNDKDSEDTDEGEDEEKTEEASRSLSLFGADSGKEENKEEESKDEDKSSETEDINEYSDEDAAALAEFLSTTEEPGIMDWEFVGAALWGGNDNLMMYFDNKDALVLHNPLLVEGDWKCLTTPIPDVYGSETSYLGNANIHTLKDNVSFTFDMKHEMEGTFEGEYKEIKDGSPVKYMGTWKDDYKRLTAQTDYAEVDIEKFIYLDSSMYGIGKIQYISGEQDYVILIRPQSRMAIIETDDWRNKSASDSKEASEAEESSKSSDSGTKTEKKTEEKSSGKLSNEEIVERAKKKSGAPIAALDGIDPDGTLNIHLYEDMGDHTATWDWYYIDPNTLKGYNTIGDPIDLN